MPIRVRWDVDFRGRVGRTKRIARQIREIAPLVVELRIEGEKGVSELSAIFTEIHKANPKVEATVALSPQSVAAARWGYPIDFIWGVAPGRPFGVLLPDGARAVSFTPDEDTIATLPDVLEDFAESAASELRLPNVNAIRAVAEKGHVPHLRPDQIRAASETIARAGIDLTGKALAIHDYFLWRVLKDAHPAAVGDRVEFAGCQAGAALVHVDWDGNVYPCDSLPIRLGNLIETPFERIWRSPARERIFAAIKATPGACDSCGSYSGCLGGCRGLAYLSSEAFDAADPACPGKTDAPPRKGPHVS